MKNEVINRRRYARIYTTLDTRFIIISEGIDGNISSGIMQAKTTSISITGACLVTNTVQIDGLHICSSISGMVKNKLKLEIDLPYNYKTITVVGEVSWYDLTSESEEYLYKVGISFIKISKEDMEVLKRFITAERKKTGSFFSFICKWFSRN